jgi:signal transduction protein with GAF and PtsI domain
MTDLQTELNKLGSLETVQKAEFMPDDLRAEIEKLRNKVHVAEIEIERERKRANEHLEKNQNITAGLFALIEPEILAAFTSMVEESIEDITKTGAFERAVESIVDDRVERDIEDAFERSTFIDGDDVDERIGDAIGDSSFDAAVRDVVREMIRDGDITISVENIEFNVNT